MCTFVCMCAHLSNMGINMCRLVYMCIYVHYVCVCICVCMFFHVFMYICMCVYVNGCVSVCIYT